MKAKIQKSRINSRFVAFHEMTYKPKYRFRIPFPAPDLRSAIRDELPAAFLLCGSTINGYLFVPQTHTCEHVAHRRFFFFSPRSPYRSRASFCMMDFGRYLVVVVAKSCRKIRREASGPTWFSMAPAPAFIARRVVHAPLCTIFTSPPVCSSTGSAQSCKSGSCSARQPCSATG